MLVIGLTGGIGSGKTTVADLFEKHGVTIIDSDQIARALTAKNQAAFNAIVAEFGSSILTPSGELDRKALRHIIFQDQSKRLWLENLLHPAIRDEMARLVEKAISPYCILVIPLLLETEPNPIINRILVVDTPEAKQIERVSIRDQQSSDAIEVILAAQTSRQHRLAKADDIIYNEHHLDALKPQVDKLHALYLSLCH